MAAVARILPRHWDGGRLLRFLAGLALIALAFGVHIGGAAAAVAAPVTSVTVTPAVQVALSSADPAATPPDSSAPGSSAPGSSASGSSAAVSADDVTAALPQGPTSASVHEPAGAASIADTADTPGHPDGPAVVAASTVRAAPGLIVTAAGAHADVTTAGQSPATNGSRAPPLR